MKLRHPSLLRSFVLLAFGLSEPALIAAPRLEILPPTSFDEPVASERGWIKAQACFPEGAYWRLERSLRLQPAQVSDAVWIPFSESAPLQVRNATWTSPGQPAGFRKWTFPLHQLPAPNPASLQQEHGPSVDMRMFFVHVYNDGTNEVWSFASATMSFWIPPAQLDFRVQGAPPPLGRPMPPCCRRLPNPP